MSVHAEFTIRQARPDDVRAMTGLLSELFSIEMDFRPDGERQQTGLFMLMEEDRGRVTVAEKDGEVVGMCTGQLVVSTAEGGWSALVEDLVVRKDCRRNGMARALLADIGSWASGSGASRLQLLADRDNDPAMKFYARIGWSLTRLICIRRNMNPGENA